MVDVPRLYICHDMPPLIILKLCIGLLYVDVGTPRVDIVIKDVQMDVTWLLAITSHWDVMLVNLVIFFTTSIFCIKNTIFIDFIYQLLLALNF